MILLTDRRLFATSYHLGSSLLHVWFILKQENKVNIKYSLSNKIGTHFAFHPYRAFFGRFPNVLCELSFENNRSIHERVQFSRNRFRPRKMLLYIMSTRVLISYSRGPCSV